MLHRWSRLQVVQGAGLVGLALPTHPSNG